MEDGRTEAAASCHVATLGGSFEQGAPWEEARLWHGHGPGLCSTACSLHGGRGASEGQPGAEMPPTGLRHGRGVSYKAVASCSGPGREFPSTGRGRAGRPGRSLLQRPRVQAPRVPLAGLQEATVFEASDGWLILCEYVPFSPWARRFCVCFGDVGSAWVLTPLPEGPLLRGHEEPACLASAAPFLCSRVHVAFFIFMK